MKLRDVLTPEHMLVPLKARTVREATQQLAEQIIRAGSVTDGERLLEVIRRAWPEDMVSVGEHAFLPHFRTDAAGKLLVALGVSPTPIRWEKDPNRTARVVILIIAPPREAPTYLQVVGAFARTLSDPDTVLHLLAAQTPEAILAVSDFDAVELSGHLTVRDVMSAGLFTIDPERTVADAVAMMVEHDIRALPVVNDAGALVGMITHKELLKHLIPEYLQRAKSGAYRAPTKAQIDKGPADPKQVLVKSVMARTVLCVAEDQTLSDVASLMNNKDVDRFPVAREGVVIGFLTRADLIRRLVAP